MITGLKKKLSGNEFIKRASERNRYQNLMITFYQLFALLFFSVPEQS